ncbi:FecR domain-containing protein [Niabella sp.]|uniref:FecR family protein n=1 Tax=Niabella sp. TaxID=1962976 RepID=UPI002638FBA3|nr:FecR domain-containing protein [Niabella sp.]
MDRDLFLTLLTKKISRELSDNEAALLETAITENAEYAQIAGAITAYEWPQAGITDPFVQDKLRATRARLAQPGIDGPVPALEPLRQKMRYGFLLKIAAVLLVMLGLAFWLFNSNNKAAMAPVAGMDTLRSGAQPLYTTLEDGTKVQLSASAFILYNRAFGRKQRHIILHGNAFFDVAKNAAVPLVVQAGPVNITVKGTAFYIDQKTPQNVSVALLRGLVEVSNRSNLNDKVLLKPNQKLSVTETTPSSLQFDITALQLPGDTGPGADTLSFKKEKLETLVPRLAKKYNASIEIRNELLKEKRFSGMFTTETLEEALESLQISYPFLVKTENNVIILE